MLKKIIRKIKERSGIAFVAGVVSAGIVFLIFLSFMVSHFLLMFEGLEVELPWATKAALTVTSPIRSTFQKLSELQPQKEESKSIQEYQAASPQEDKVQPDQPLTIMTADITIEVESFDKTYDEIMKIAQKFDGFIADSSVYVDEEGKKEGTIVLRVPQKSFYNVLSLVEKLGYCRFKSIKGEDVTEEYIDLETRVRNLKKEEKQLLNIMEKAFKVKEILEVSKELSRVRGEIERITGRIKYLENRVNLSTITITLKEKIISKMPTRWNIVDTFKNAVNSLLKVVMAIISFTIWILVFSPLIIFVILIWKIVKRRKKV